MFTAKGVSTRPSTCPRHWVALQLAVWQASQSICGNYLWAHELKELNQAARLAGAVVPTAVGSVLEVCCVSGCQVVAEDCEVTLWLRESPAGRQRRVQPVDRSTWRRNGQATQ